jgi:TRAP-type C4-dicarboxylate transport system permease small subunit
MNEVKPTKTASVLLSLDRIDNAFFTAEKFFLVMIGILMTVATLIEIVMRYVFNSTLLVGISELINWGFVWLVLIGCAALAKTQGHMSINLFLNKFPAKLRKVVIVVTNIALIAYFAKVVATGWEFALQQWSIKTTAANIPKTWLFLAIPVGMTLMLIHIGIQTVHRIKAQA